MALVSTYIYYSIPTNGQNANPYLTNIWGWEWDLSVSMHFESDWCTPPTFSQWLCKQGPFRKLSNHHSTCEEKANSCNHLSKRSSPYIRWSNFYLKQRVFKHLIHKKSGRRSASGAIYFAAWWKEEVASKWGISSLCSDGVEVIKATCSPLMQGEKARGLGFMHFSPFPCTGFSVSLGCSHCLLLLYMSVVVHGFPPIVVAAF